MSLTPAFLDELRARTTLSTLIAKSVKLQRAGKEFRACCPFHDEKTPSFYVNDDKGFYHCFGCGAHGDAIRWMTDQRGLPFIDAVKELAQAAGLDMPEQDRRAAEKAERAKGLHELMSEAATWFTERLNGIEGAEARAVLQRRGITAETARNFGLGFAPDSRGKLKEALKSYGDPMLVESGMLIAVEGKEPYDRFRGRLMIPIRDVRGRVIAFGGRIIGEGEPKYLNSPETPLFDKGRTLYNLDRAQAAARKADRVIAVEGYMDVIALAQAGFGEVVAPLGTALTEHQLERLWRLSEVPLLCFDGDGAGQKAALRAAHRALPMLAPGRSLAFVTLPQGLDPDDLVRTQGPAAFESLLARPEPLVDRLWVSEVAAGPLDTPEQRAGLKRRLTELAEQIQDPNVKHEYIAEFRARADQQFGRGPREFRKDQRGPAPARQQQRGTRNARGGWQPPEPPPSHLIKGVQASGLDPLFAKLIVRALAQAPHLIREHLELLERVKTGNHPYHAVLDAMLDAGFRERQLDTARMLTILAEQGLDQQVRQLLRADASSLTSHRGGDENRLSEMLMEVLAVLDAWPRVEQQLALSAEALKMDFDDSDLQRQSALVRERQNLQERLQNLRLAYQEVFEE